MTGRHLLWCSAVMAGVTGVIMGCASRTNDPTLPATKSGQIVGDWMRLCQTPNLDEMTKWWTEHLPSGGGPHPPAADVASDQRDACQANGGFRLDSVTRDQPHETWVRMVGLKSGTWFRLNLMTDTTGKIMRIGMGPTTPPESSMPKDLSDTALASDVSQLVARVSAAGLFSGIVVVARDTQIIASASGGFANRAARTPITTSTQFTLGSMGKMFTAAAIGQLVDQGKVSFSDTVGKFFPKYPNETVRDRVTVGMLLSHKAGLGDFLRARTPQMMTKGVTRAAEFMPLYDSAAPLFPPGTGWSYSNAGLALAGAIVEQVSKQNYPDYIKQHIFAVAGMPNSDPNNIPHVTPQMVTPYTQFSDSGPPTGWHEAEHDVGSPAGSAISTAHDLVHFAAALRNGRLEQDSTFAEMTKPRDSRPSGEGYGYAMEIHPVYGRTVAGHGGGFPGVNTHLYLILGSPYTVVVLTNQDPPDEEYAGQTALAWVTEKAKREAR